MLRSKQDKDNFTHLIMQLAMLRILGHVIPDNKSLWIGLTMVYGIGRVKSMQVITDLWLDPMKKVKDVTDDEQKLIIDAFKTMVLENDLRRQVMSNIKRLKEIKCYRWMRHNLGLPVRGQSTRKNARTAKKLLWRSKVRPVLKK